MFALRQLGGKSVIETEKVGVECKHGRVRVLGWLGEEIRVAQGASEHVDGAEPNVEVKC